MSKVDEILALANSGLTQVEIGARVGVSNTYVCTIMRAFGISRMSKITNEQKDDILRLANGDLTQREIAARVRVNVNTVGAVMRRYGVSRRRGRKPSVTGVIKRAAERENAIANHARIIAARAACWAADNNRAVHVASVKFGIHVSAVRTAMKELGL